MSDIYGYAELHRQEKSVWSILLRGLRRLMDEMEG